MKSLQDFKTLLEEEKSDYSKFDTLVRAGLANKAQMQRIHKILDKMGEEKPQFNNADRMIIQNLFNKMVDLISNNKQINTQARRAVKESIDESISVVDTSDYKLSPSGKKVKAHRIKVGDKVDRMEEEIEVTEEPVILQEDKDPPLVLVIKRKAIRMYPDGTRIALYYNERLKKYFSVPYQYGSGMDAPIQSEEVVSEMNIGKKKPKPDTHHIVDKEGKTLSLASYLDKASAVKDLEKHPGGKVVTLGPKGKVKEEVEQIDEIGDPAEMYRKATEAAKAKLQTMRALDRTREYEKKRLETSKLKTQKEEVEITEAVMDQLHKIVNNKQAQSVKFASGHTRKVDHFTASAITQVHKVLNDDNKKKFADMVHKSPTHLQKAADFAFKQAK